MHQWFCVVPYIILISSESTVPALFIPLFSHPINLVTLPNLKENITALMIIVLSDTWHDCHILLVAVDSSWNTRRGFCQYYKSRRKQMTVIYTIIIYSSLGDQSHLFCGYHCMIEWQTEAKYEAKVSVPTRWQWIVTQQYSLPQTIRQVKKETIVFPLGWWGLQCQLIRLIVLIVFLLVVTIDSVNCINCIDRIKCIDRIDPGVLNCSSMQLKDNSDDPTKSEMTFWGKKGEILRLLAFTGVRNK